MDELDKASGSLSKALWNAALSFTGFVAVIIQTMKMKACAFREMFSLVFSTVFFFVCLCFVFCFLFLVSFLGHLL